MSVQEGTLLPHFSSEKHDNEICNNPAALAITRLIRLFGLISREQIHQLFEETSGSSEPLFLLRVKPGRFSRRVQIPSNKPPPGISGRLQRAGEHQRSGEDVARADSVLI